MTADAEGAVGMSDRLLCFLLASPGRSLETCRPLFSLFRLGDGSRFLGVGSLGHIYSLLLLLNKTVMIELLPLGKHHG
jgi:hypothetical protein